MDETSGEKNGMRRMDLVELELANGDFARGYLEGAYGNSIEIYRDPLEVESFESYRMDEIICIKKPQWKPQ